jgi:hypothetical protein
MYFLPHFLKVETFFVSFWFKIFNAEVEFVGFRWHIQNYDWSLSVSNLGPNLSIFSLIFFLFYTFSFWRKYRPNISDGIEKKYLDFKQEKNTSRFYLILYKFIFYFFYQNNITQVLQIVQLLWNNNTTIIY